MKFIFKQGTRNMKYQRFELEYSKNQFTNMEEAHDGIIEMIVLSLMYNTSEYINPIFYDGRQPYTFEGFQHKHKRGFYKNDVILIYYNPILGSHTDIFHGYWSNRRGWGNDTFIISAEVNWELVDERYHYLEEITLNPDKALSYNR